MKIPKKFNKIKGHSITWSHNWHFDILMCVYWLDINSEKVWWRYVIPNTNAVHFCDIFSYLGTVADLLKNLENKKKNPVTLGSIRIVYHIFSQFSRSLHKLIYAKSGLQSNDTLKSKMALLVKKLLKFNILLDFIVLGASLVPLGIK